MHYTVKIFGYAGELRAVVECEGDRTTVCQVIVDESGAARGEATDERGRVETIGKGAAFVTVDGGRPRRAEPFLKLQGSKRSRAVRAPRAWYGAAIMA
jgi:hypothetical protein